jgi:hypothetical protein
MKRIVKVLRGGHYAHKFTDVERAQFEKKHPGLKFVPDDVGIHLLQFNGMSESHIVEVVSDITKTLNIIFEGGFQTKHGHSSAPGQRSSVDVTFSPRLAGVAVVHSPYTP